MSGAAAGDWPDDNDRRIRTACPNRAPASITTCDGTVGDVARGGRRREPCQSFLARNMTASSLAQVWSVIVGVPVISPISFIIFDASSGFVCTFAASTSDTADAFSIALSAEHAAKAGAVTQAHSKPAARTVFSIGSIHSIVGDSIQAGGTAQTPHLMAGR